MKAIKNKVHCLDCGRAKMLFETEKKALTFIKFNKDEIEAENGYRPVRTYYCMFCNGWHTTSNPKAFGKSRNEYLFEKFQKSHVSELKYSNKGKAELLIEDKTKALNARLSSFSLNEVKTKLSEHIKQLNSEIEALCQAGKKFNEMKIKDLRYDLQAAFLVRKQKGIKK